VPQVPLSAPDPWQTRIDEISRSLNRGLIHVPLARVDEEHLSRADLAVAAPVIEVEVPHGDDQRNWDRVAVLRHMLSRFQPQPDHTHRSAVGDLLETEGTPRSFRALRCHRRRISCPPRGWKASPSKTVVINRLIGVDGARRARGLVVVIDVLRSFTVSAYALAGGARECLLVRTTAEARALHEKIGGSLICAEEDALPVPGIPISNSPTQIKAADVRDRVLVQRSSAGTTVMSAAESANMLYAASLVVARATARACMLNQPPEVTLIASADHPEDHACASYIEGLLRGEEPDPVALLQPLRESARFARAMSGAWPGFPPTDLDLALAPDRFDFAMPAQRQDGYLRLTALVAGGRNG